MLLLYVLHSLQSRDRKLEFPLKMPDGMQLGRYFRIRSNSLRRRERAACRRGRLSLYVGSTRSRQTELQLTFLNGSLEHREQQMVR